MSPLETLDEAWGVFRASLVGQGVEWSAEENVFTAKRVARTRVFLLRSTDSRLSHAVAARVKALGAGVSLRWGWEGIEPQSNRFNLSGPLADVSLCRELGIPFMMRMMCGFRSPAHSSGHWVQA